ncbi:2258_t:CDS:2 [Diversispora eburnea]|uniref:2258_t:CDS:1 n=1 Tax=Diversispora eburnea TaxID=1213867 RepID=A0A9N9G5G8_9GLOM|nr:2258_t:CDS:2 [Diversispora eburnea]
MMFGTTIRYIPLRSWAETDTCRNAIFPYLTQKNVLELYKKWGGIPRFTLFYALNISQQELLEKAINSVNDKILSFVVGEEVEETEEISEVEDSGEPSPAIISPNKNNEEGTFAEFRAS